MSDVSRDASIEGEAPVNPYSLLEAVNASSQSAYTAWLLFLGVGAYLLVAVAGVTHRDLLLAGDIALPVLQVRLELTRFFLIVPAALLFMHVALLAQFVILARKALELDSALRMIEATDRRSHPLRLELSSFFFVQAIAGPERSRVVGVLLHGLSWLTLGLLPVLALLFVQATFLPYHHIGITWVHRALVAADLVVLGLTAAFLVSTEQSLRQAGRKAMRLMPIRSTVAGLGSAAGIGLAFLVMTVPGEPLDVLAGGDAQGSPVAVGSGDAANAGAHGGPTLFGLIERNLNVRDQDLTGGGKGDGSRRSVNLRERDLRYARLDRSALPHADLTGANLDGASLVGADLRGVTLGCVEDDRPETSGDRQAAGCGRALGANLTRARLAGAMLGAADLSGARLAGADLSDAVLANADLSGADLSAADLDKADLSEAVLRGANLSTASLVGADLTNATLTGAELSKAVLRAAVLNGAALEGATLRDADLEAASLFRARLFAADLTGARLKAASLREGRVWLARTPEGAESALADFAGLDAKLPPHEEREALAQLLERVGGAGGGHREETRLRLKDSQDANGTEATSEASWAGLIQASHEASAQMTTVIGSLVPTGSRITGGEPTPAPVQTGGLAEQLRLSDRRARLTRHLAELACQARAADGAVATGITRRALGPGFNGDPGALLDHLRRPECVGGRAVPAALLDRLAGAVDTLGTR